MSVQLSDQYTPVRDKLEELKKLFLHWGGELPEPVIRHISEALALLGNNGAPPNGGAVEAVRNHLRFIRTILTLNYGDASVPSEAIRLCNNAEQALPGSNR